MTSTDLNTYLTFAYLATVVCYLVAYVSGLLQSNFRKVALALFLAVFAVHAGSIAWRWIESYQIGIGHAPLSNLYESLVFFAWTVALALVVVRLRYKADLIVLLGLPLVFLIMASTFLTDSKIKPLIPALQSNWLVAHVMACFLGYAGFAVSFVAAVLSLMTRSSQTLEQHLPREDLLDEIVYRSVLIGMPMLTVGIITGAAWADYAWGSYWSWDPKETWSLITWLVYSAFLHARITRGWTGNRMALLSVLGFAAVLFTYFGVNYLPGLHSYL
jgi:cytochrome c-type biogenesis protein CcsB